MELSADTGLTMFAYTAESGSKSEQALNLLASSSATADQAELAHARRRWRAPRAAILAVGAASDDQGRSTSQYMPRRGERRNDSRHAPTGGPSWERRSNRPLFQASSMLRGNRPAGLWVPAVAGSNPVAHPQKALETAARPDGLLTPWTTRSYHDRCRPGRLRRSGRSASNRRTASTLRASGVEPGGDHSLDRTNRTRGCSVSTSVHSISTPTMQSLARPALNSTFRAHDR